MGQNDNEIFLPESINDELCLGTDSQIVGCNGNGGVLCEITLNKDTHICLDNELLTSVKIDFSTKLDVPSQVSTYSNTLCVKMISISYIYIYSIYSCR